jgi:hypothetical protein
MHMLQVEGLIQALYMIYRQCKQCLRVLGEV